MKKTTVLITGAITLCAGQLMLNVNAAPRKKRGTIAAPAQQVARVKPAAYSTRKFNLSQAQLLQDVGPVSRQKTISVTIPKHGLKNAALVQFRPTADETLTENQVDQVLVRTQPLSQKKAIKRNIDWVPGKAQTLVEVFAGQGDPTAEQNRLTRQHQYALLKSELANKGPLKVKVRNNGQVGIKMKGNDGKYNEVTNFHVAQHAVAPVAMKIQ